MSNLNASVALPPESLDNILQHIFTSGEGQQTLVACGLVAIWWAEPSQRRLFSSVSIYKCSYGKWTRGAVRSGSTPHPLEHVRSLTHCRSTNSILKYQMRDLPQDSGEYLSALRNIRNLTLCDIKVEDVGEEGFRACCSAFRETLAHLSLDAFTTSFGGLVTSVDYFPNITTLQLSLFAQECDTRPVPSLSRPLRGKVHTLDVRTHCSRFFDRFTKLDTRLRSKPPDEPFDSTRLAQLRYHTPWLPRAPPSEYSNGSKPGPQKLKDRVPREAGSPV